MGRRLHGKTPEKNIPALFHLYLCVDGGIHVTLLVTPREKWVGSRPEKLEESSCVVIVCIANVLAFNVRSDVASRVSGNSCMTCLTRAGMPRLRVSSW